ncbi:unnamed protein product, partial [Rotaria sp. Silwood1]
SNSKKGSSCSGMSDL